MFDQNEEYALGTSQLTTLDKLDLVQTMLSIEPTARVLENLRQIQTICETRFSDQGFFGNTILNRKMLLDSVIAVLLTPEVVYFVFTCDPNSSLIKIYINHDRLYSLRKAIRQGFELGLDLIRMMPNNEWNYNSEAYDKQQINFRKNTLKIASNIATASGIFGLERITEFDPKNVSAQYERIVKTIRAIKDEKNGPDKLLNTSGYGADAYRAKTRDGFDTLCKIMGYSSQKLDGVTLEEFCNKFLNNPEAMLNGTVTHLFYGRTHIALGIEQETTYQFKDSNYTFEAIFGKMAALVTDNPQDYPTCATEQLYARFTLLENKLSEDFPKMPIQI